MIETLRQIANGVGGIDAGDLISKGEKQSLYSLGYVWPAYGTDFRLTPSGKAFAESVGIEVSPFACIGEIELRGKRESVCDSQWDFDRFDEWIKKAIPE